MKRATLSTTPPAGTDATAMTDDALLTFSEVCDRLRVAPRTARRWLSAGVLPKPDYRLAGSADRWRAATITKWLESQAAGDAPARRLGRPVTRTRRGRFTEAAS